MLRLQIILGSTRPGRQGERVARWVHGLASGRDDFSCELLDLRDWPLPFFDEPKPPAYGEYTSEPAVRWVEKVAEGEAYLVVSPEYNHSIPAVLKNALDFPYKSWNEKPMGVVSYSAGPGAGYRAVEALRLVAIELQMAPIREQVSLPRVHRLLSEDGVIPDERDREFHERALHKTLDQLARWGAALRSMRG